MDKISVERQFDHYERFEIGGKIVWVPGPVNIPEFRFVGREEIIEKALSAWAEFDGQSPLNFRFYGPPGVGKNAIVYELARILKKDLYIINGHEELGPEDIACSATMTSRNTIEYVASPFFAGMLKGGIVFFDEIGKAPPGALNPLASVLDDRRTLTSVLAGIRLKAHEGFRFCAALNETEEGGGLPPFLDERTRPAIHVGYPSLQEMQGILESRFSGPHDQWIKVFLSEFNSPGMSARNVIKLLEYATRLYANKNRGGGKPTKKEIKDLLSSLLKDMRLYDKDNDKGNGNGQDGNRNTVENKNAHFTNYKREGAVH